MLLSRIEKLSLVVLFAGCFSCSNGGGGQGALGIKNIPSGNGTASSFNINGLTNGASLSSGQVLTGSCASGAQVNIISTLLPGNSATVSCIDGNFSITLDFIPGLSNQSGSMEFDLEDGSGNVLQTITANVLATSLPAVSSASSDNSNSSAETNDSSSSLSSTSSSSSSANANAGGPTDTHVLWESPIYMDSQCTQMDSTGYVLVYFDVAGSLINMIGTTNIYPPGAWVTWEWSFDKIWGSAGTQFYAYDPSTGLCVSAFNSSANFIGEIVPAQ